MTFVWTFTTLIISVIVLIAAAVCCYHQLAAEWVFAVDDVAGSLSVCHSSRWCWSRSISRSSLRKSNHRNNRRWLCCTMSPAACRLRTLSIRKSPAEKPKTRARRDRVRSLCRNSGSRVEGRMKIVFEPFSSQPPTGEKGTDLSAALQSTADKFPNLRGVVLLSDGDWNIGQSPGTAASALRVKNVPVFAVGVGSEERLPDMQLAASDAPTFGVVNKSLRIPFRIISWLPADRDVKVSLTGTRGEKIEKTVRVSGMGQQQDTIDWKPEKTGEYSSDA